MEITGVKCFLETWAISPFLWHVKSYFARKHDCFIPLCHWTPFRSFELPNAHRRFCRPPQHRSHNISGTLQGASASESLTGPCPKLLLAVFQLSAFILVCLAALRATACHSPGVMCAPAACVAFFFYFFIFIYIFFFFGLQLFLCCC